MKLKSQLELIQSVRKSFAPSVRRERPSKGVGSFRRRDKHQKGWSDE